MNPYISQSTSQPVLICCTYLIQDLTCNFCISDHEPAHISSQAYLNQCKSAPSHTWTSPYLNLYISYTGIKVATSHTWSQTHTYLNTWTHISEPVKSKPMQIIYQCISDSYLTVHNWFSNPILTGAYYLITKTWQSLVKMTCWRKF